MKPMGLRTEIPTMRARPQFGVVTGNAVLAETGDAVQGAVVRLNPVEGTDGQRPPWRSTDSTGGFAFDSVSPGDYRLLALRIGVLPDTATIRVTKGSVDTVHFRMHVYRCYGY